MCAWASRKRLDKRRACGGLGGPWCWVLSIPPCLAPRSYCVAGPELRREERTGEAQSLISLEVMPKLAGWQPLCPG